MNPPSALHGAMNRDRKPFTYTPGGLNLSEIKSERMAKRLMRNAMNQGVPETPAQSLKSPPISSNMAIPNFNCLPVQVFPSFNLPSNPKSLLRTRSNPDQPKEPPIKKVAPVPQVTTSYKPPESDYNRPFNYNNNAYPYSSVNNNNYVNTSRPVSMYEYNTPPTNFYDNKTSYGSDGFTVPLLPEKRYDAEYYQVTPQGSKALKDIEFVDNQFSQYPKILSEIEPEKKLNLDVLEKPVTDGICDPIEIVKPFEDSIATDDDQKEVKVVQKQVNINENQNGNANVEAAVTVKLPVKKSAAKTETKVEIENKILPDGTVEETKTTTTKTTIDGKTEISTKTEKRILSKEEADAVIEVEEEEIEVDGEGEEGNEEQVVIETVETSSTRKENEQKETEACEIVEVEESEQQKPKENGHDGLIVKEEERQEITTTKKVVVIQSDDEEEEVVEEEEEEEEEVEVKKESQREEAVEEQENVTEYNIQEANEVQVEEQQVEEEDEEVEQEEIKTETKEEKEADVKDEEEEKEVEEVEVEEVQESVEAKPVKDDEITKEQEEEEVEEEEEYEEAEETEVKEESKEKLNEKVEDDTKDVEEPQTVQETETKSEEIPIKVIIETKETPKTDEPKEEPKITEEKPIPQPEQKPPLREPSIPLEKVLDVEIKPIGLGNDLFTKSHTEIITTTTDKPLGGLSTQTEYNRIENIVTVNRTTKTLDQAYEQMIQPSIPTVKTYFAPPSRDPVSVSPQPTRPYQPVYTPEQPERRHSLLLERISVERQIPSADIYQNQYNQTEERQWSQEPQSEVLTVSNVKPSTITKNQQWYQQTKKENVSYNNVTPTISTTPSQQWNQPQPQPQPQFQSQPQPQYQSQSQPQYQSQPQPQYQSQPQPQYQSQPQPQYQSQPQPQYQAPQPQYQPPPAQPSYTENIVKDSYKSTSNYTQNLYPGYSPKPTNWTSTADNQNYLKKDSTEAYQTTQQYSSSYVPPPWEQDSGYVADTANQNFFQPSPATSTFTPANTASTPGWKTTPPVGKFTKPTPTSYIPPAPNQSFVKPVSNLEPPKLPGRKTYYSEYERRYISVPESTYIPTESKYQVQPDPSPKYYYDNNEPVETVEPQWRKELREFTEKTSQTTVQTETTVRPPWEEDPKYVKTEYTPTPTWSQTLKPRSWRERSFESEYVGSKEWPKTNTLGRGRPQSSYVKSGVNSPIPERTRGVSVDRYNPNSYQSPIPSKHPPAQTYTLNVQSQNYHNPSVPAYHARTAADTREQPVVYQQSRPHWSSESRSTPIQSRSFKYLQWITGTED